MSVTKRVPTVAFCGALFTLGALPFGLHLYAFLFANILLVGFLLLDIMLTPDGKVFSVQWGAAVRDGEHFYFRAENVILFTVRNHSRVRLWVQALGGMGDDTRFFETTTQNMTHFLEAGQERDFSYTVIPAKRGSFQFERVFLRYRGVLGFCVKHTSLACPAPLKVYPNVRDISKYRLMMQKSRLLPAGDKRIRQFGNGAEFESLRSYVEGDDYRKINWSATAREGKFIVNQYQIERNQPVYILLDASRPMSYSVNGHKKLDYAINAALILCDIVNQQGDQAGLLTFDTRVGAHIKPGKGAAHRNTLMEALYHVEGNRATADYEGAFRALNEGQKRRALVFIFTDFEMLEEAETLITHMALLKKRHMPIVVFMENESLAAMAQTPGHSKKDDLLRYSAQEFLDERKMIFSKLNAMRIPNVESPAESFAVSAVNRYLQCVRG